MACAEAGTGGKCAVDNLGANHRTNRAVVVARARNHLPEPARRVSSASGCESTENRISRICRTRIENSAGRNQRLLRPAALWRAGQAQRETVRHPAVIKG